MDLRVLIEPNVDLERLAKDLDELGHEGRVWATRAWTRPLQQKLYEAAKGFRKVTLDAFVPPSVGPLVEVIHEGRNSLPMHNHFQKRFAKAGEEVVGYNHQSLSGFTGPGYFVAHPSETEGEVDIDYTMTPKEKVPSWPAIGTTAIGKLVFGGMIDVMRGISTHVSIGRAKKKNGFMDAWFVLVRKDPG